MKQLVDDIHRSGSYNFANRGGCSHFVTGCTPYVKSMSIPNYVNKPPNEVQPILVRHGPEIRTTGQCRMGCPSVSCFCVRQSRADSLTGVLPRLGAPVGSLYLPQYRHTDIHFSSRSLGNSEQSAFHST
ncbi:hypothetical protein FSP39_009439 [Pinctada imbricata]|uniref:Uncharacterized protein n=1 Tax=Pinctada imbricata TaxID=66713 RepID=A0AA88Y319_PINIB|nr:hypothetical protein FSP39_009439 [Pinctada imbricata]